MTLPIDSGKWIVDPTHSRMGFIAKHLGFTKVRGSFTDYTSEINVGDSLETSSIKVTANLNSVNTGNEDRDNHLKGADFFGGSENPTMEFISTSIKGEADEFEISGDLTINDKTMPVTFKSEFGGTLVDPFGNTKAGFEAKAEINRTDFGIDWNVPVGGGVLVSEKIKIELEIQLTPVS
jgi:polyisoprenoid-binding protein YceI